MQLRSLMMTAFLFAAFAVPAVAEVRLVGAEVPPFVYKERDVAKGVAYDLVREMAKRVGHSGKLEVVPFARALKMAETEANVLYFSIGRTPPREGLFQWVIPLLKEAFVLAASSKSQFDISSFEAVKELRVGVMRASAGQSMAKNNGMNHIEDVTTEELNAEKLNINRIDVWVGSWNAMLQAQRNAGLATKDLRRGAAIQKLDLYLAGSLNLDKDEADKWREAYESVKKDGTFSRILMLYQYELPSGN